jgi:aspartyl-tRNA(Asn)/glutamyl-tRNA(Gln) amidotransferase subunit A
MDRAICYLSAHELLAHYRAKTLSPVEVVRSVLDQAARLNPLVNALAFVVAESALAAARASEERWVRGSPTGRLDGVPVTVKDSLAVAEMPTSRGTRALDGTPLAQDDAPAVARIKEHGAVIIGKTTMPDFGMMASGISSLYGVTRNPWNLARNSGGSSAGAGAALASGIGALAIGTDIGGSIRIPAAFCGVVGLKPSYGRVPVAEPAAGLVAGPMARDVADAALLLRVIAQPDARDYAALPWEDRDYLDGSEGGLDGCRIGLMLDIGFGLPAAPEVRALVAAGAEQLGGLGALIEPMLPIFDEDPEPAFDLMLQAYAWPGFAALGPERQAQMLPEIASWCRCSEGLSAEVLIAALSSVAAARRRVVAACGEYDFVVTPTMAVPAYAAELPWPPGGTRHNPFCFPFNLSEQPALSVCCGRTADGLPVGMQVVGQRFDDAGVFRLGLALERARGKLRFPAI